CSMVLCNARPPLYLVFHAAMLQQYIPRYRLDVVAPELASEREYLFHLVVVQPAPLRGTRHPGKRIPGRVHALEPIMQARSDRHFLRLGWSRGLNKWREQIS